MLGRRDGIHEEIRSAQAIASATAIRWLYNGDLRFRVQYKGNDPPEFSETSQI
jgi:hypothetical protein